MYGPDWQNDKLYRYITSVDPDTPLGRAMIGQADEVAQALPATAKPEPQPPPPGAVPVNAYYDTIVVKGKEEKVLVVEFLEFHEKGGA